MFADALSRPPSSAAINTISLESGPVESGHFGPELTVNSLRKTFYWPNLYTDTVNFVLSCDTCQSANSARPRTRLPLSSLEPKATTFGDRLHLDLVDMPKSSSGKVAICTIVDAATGFVIVHPCSDKTHAGVIDALRTKVFPNFGCPRLLVTDKGKENMNQEVSKFLKHYHINHITCSTGHPQSNGMVERRQQMIISYFKNINSFSRLPSTLGRSFARLSDLSLIHI